MRKNPLHAAQRTGEVPKRVAVLVDTSTTWGRGIITGIQDYARRHGNWHLFVEARGIHDSTVLPRDWHGDGIIARIGSPEAARELRMRRIPVVNVSGIRLPGTPFPCVCNDGEAAARMAMDYFLARGFRHFAYLSLRGLEYVARQCGAFQEAAEAAGCDCAVHGVKAHSGFISPDWNLHLGELSKWLVSLPKPVAVLSWGGAREVIHACLQSGLRVPEEVAVMSATDDDLLSEVSPIRLSGVRNACEKIGTEAAAMLDEAMRGKPVPMEPLRIAPIGVVTRQSTDTLAITDGTVVAAIAYIDAKLGSKIMIDDVARAAGVSRSGLERRFSQVLGVSPALYLTRVRLDRVKHLLSSTDMTIAEISDHCGFSTPEYMTAVFREQSATTPLRYRKSTRVH
jgi:LacI family transcriptional regulator